MATIEFVLVCLLLFIVNNSKNVMSEMEYNENAIEFQTSDINNDDFEVENIKAKYEREKHENDKQKTYGIDYYFGKREQGDGLVYYANHKKTAKLFRIVSEDVIYPLPGHWGKTITCITIKDLYRKDKGGYAQITSGGIGKYNVSLHLESQRSAGYNFAINIFAKQ